MEGKGILENYEGHDMFIVSGSGSGTGISVTGAALPRGMREEKGRESPCFVSAVACAACDSSRVGCLHARDSSAGGGGGRRLRLRDHGQRRQRPGETSTPLRKFTKLFLPLSMAGAGAADGSAGGGRGRAPTWWWATATSRAPTWPATTASCRARCVGGLPCCVSKYNTVIYLYMVEIDRVGLSACAARTKPGAEGAEQGRRGRGQACQAGSHA